VKKASEQLAYLERLGAEVELKNLQTAYDAYVAAHPEAAAAPAATEPAKTDSASVAGSGGK
jgi:hypothetical protein